MRVEIFPEPAAAAGIAKQIKGSSRACGVFHVAKMFLDRPERYRVKITALDPSAIDSATSVIPPCNSRVHPRGQLAENFRRAPPSAAPKLSRAVLDEMEHSIRSMKGPAQIDFVPGGQIDRALPSVLN